MSNEPAAPRATFKEGDYYNEGEAYSSIIDVARAQFQQSNSAHFQQSNRKETNFILIYTTLYTFN